MTATEGAAPSGTPGPLAVLGEIRGRLRAARADRWAVSERNGGDIDGEGWSEVAVVDPDEQAELLLPLPPQVALTFLSDVLEPRNDEANTAFIANAGKDIARLLAMLDAALKPHEPVTVYRNADDCGHECPPEPDWNARPPEDSAERAEWDAAAEAWDAFREDHTYGSGPDGGSGDVRICMLSPGYEACPACSALVYGTHGDDDCFIRAEECTVRPAVIAAALSGEEVTPS